MVSSPPPLHASPDPLRFFLRDHLTPAQVRAIASAHYEIDIKGIAAEFQRNLETGEWGYHGYGNPFECAMLQQFHDERSPMYELFGAWWVGTFCSDTDNFAMIDTIGPDGIQSLLRLVIQSCTDLGDLGPQAARAAVPFVHWLSERDPTRQDGARAMYAEAAEALEALRHARAQS